MTNKKATKKQITARIIAIAVAAVMTLSIILMTVVRYPRRPEEKPEMKEPAHEEQQA